MMKRVLPAIGLLVLVTSPLALGDVTFHLYAYGTTDTTLDVEPGNTASFWVRFFADEGDEVAGVRYDIQLPVEGWVLESREYAPFGWYEEDGLWDNSVPTSSGTPVTIMNDTYPGGEPDTADFRFANALDPSGTTVTGWATCEVFELTVPSDTPLGPYTITLADTFAYDTFGGQFDSSGRSFELNAVPEPVSSALLLAGIGVLAMRRRMRT